MPVDLTIDAPGEPEVQVESGAEDPTLEPLLGEVTPVHVEEKVVRGLLSGIGGTVSHLVGDDDVADHWRFTERELNDLAPPLTRMINRRPKLQRAVIRGDEMTVAIVFAGYMGRNADALRKAQKARGERDGNEQREDQRNAPGPVGNSSTGLATGVGGLHGANGRGGMQ